MRREDRPDRGDMTHLLGGSGDVRTIVEPEWNAIPPGSRVPEAPDAELSFALLDRSREVKEVRSHCHRGVPCPLTSSSTSPSTASSVQARYSRRWPGASASNPDFAFAFLASAFASSGGTGSAARFVVGRATLMPSALSLAAALTSLTIFASDGRSFSEVMRPNWP